MTSRSWRTRSSCVATLFTLGFAPLEAFQSLSDFSRSVRTLTQKVSPAVVQVLVSGYGASSEGEGQEVSLLSRQRSSGSGVIVDSTGAARSLAAEKRDFLALSFGRGAITADQNLD